MFSTTKMIKDQTETLSTVQPQGSPSVLSKEYAHLKGEFVEFLFSILVDERPIFCNDLDALLTYTAISRYYLRDERVGLAPEDPALDERHGLSTTRIARSTRIPRETVRRKLLLLESKGLLERGPHDEWRVAVRDGQPVIRTQYALEWEREMTKIVNFVRALKDRV
jgi:hypothetical protein